MKQPADPTPEEILELAAAIRAQRSEWTRRRMDKRGQPYQIPQVRSAIKIQDTEGE